MVVSSVKSSQENPMFSAVSVTEDNTVSYYVALSEFHAMSGQWIQTNKEKINFPFPIIKVSFPPLENIFI